MRSTTYRPQNEEQILNVFAAQYDNRFNIGKRPCNIGVNQRVADRRAQRKAELAAIFAKCV